jgi:hypothetical protein
MCDEFFSYILFNIYFFIRYETLIWEGVCGVGGNSMIANLNKRSLMHCCGQEAEEHVLDRTQYVVPISKQFPLSTLYVNWYKLKTMQGTQHICRHVANCLGASWWMGLGFYPSHLVFITCTEKRAQRVRRCWLYLIPTLTSKQNLILDQKEKRKD